MNMDFFSGTFPYFSCSFGEPATSKAAEKTKEKGGGKKNNLAPESAMRSGVAARRRAWAGLSAACQLSAGACGGKGKATIPGASRGARGRRQGLVYTYM